MLIHSSSVATFVNNWLIAFIFTVHIMIPELCYHSTVKSCYLDLFNSQHVTYVTGNDALDIKPPGVLI